MPGLKFQRRRRRRRKRPGLIVVARIARGDAYAFDVTALMSVMFGVIMTSRPLVCDVCARVCRLCAVFLGGVARSRRFYFYKLSFAFAVSTIACGTGGGGGVTVFTP